LRFIKKAESPSEKPVIHQELSLKVLQFVEYSLTFFNV
jgi:hypothetical protein